MSKRSPLGSGASFTIPAFNPGDVQSHMYWGQYVYDAAVPNKIQGRSGSVGSVSLPNESNNALANPEWSKLRVGDLASTAFDSATASGGDPGTLARAQMSGIFVCIYPGAAASDGLAVWERLDEAVAFQQTIRDAHVIVVGQSGHLNPGLPQSPDALGITCDYLDIGDGVQLQAACAAAVTAGQNIDIRVRPCDIVLAAAPSTVSVPDGCRLIGAGRESSLITGVSAINLSQTVIKLGHSSSLEDFQVYSPPPTILMTAGADEGVVWVTADAGSVSAEIRRCTITFERSVVEDMARLVTAAIRCRAPGKDLLIDDCVLNTQSLADQFVPAVSQGVHLGNASVATLAVTDPEIRNTAIYGGKGVTADQGVRLENMEGGRCFNVEIIGAGGVVGAPAADYYGFSWSYALAGNSLVRLPKFIECSYTTAPAPSSDTASQAGFIVTMSGTPAVTAYSGMIHDCVALFNGGQLEGATRTGFLILNTATDTAELLDITVDNCKVLGGHLGFDIRTGAGGQVNARITSLKMTACNARAMLDAGLAAPRGVIITGASTGTANVVDVGIVNCDFGRAPATGVGIDITTSTVRDTLVGFNSLVPTGGTAIVDAGTGTEAAHNITV